MPVGAAKRARLLHFPDDFGRERLSGLIVLREGLQQLFIAEEFFEHLRWNFDEVAFGGEAGKACPLRVAAEDGVHEVAELVEERDDVGVLQEAGIAAIASGVRGGWAGKVADERGFRQVAAAHAGDDRGGGEPFVFALARVHVEIETADDLRPSSKTSKTETAGSHAGAVDGRNSTLKSCAAVSSTPASTLLVGEVGAHGLRVEIVMRSGETARTSSRGW